MPLVQWFWAAYLVTTHTPGLSALQFARQMDMNYETAFQMLHKLRAAMVKEGQERLSGIVEVDECYVGGVRSGGKEGRGAPDKVVVAGVVVAGAVEVRGRRAGRIRLRVVRGVSTESLTGFVKATVEEGSTILTDGWKSYNALGAMGYQHKLEVEGDRERAMEILPLVHLVFSNLKTWLLGTHHGSVKKQHMQAYLNEFTFRFNRRRTPMAAFQTVLGLIAEWQGPTYAGLYDVVRGGDSWQHPNAPTLAVAS
jgi:transposase-like protein